MTAKIPLAPGGFSAPPFRPFGTSAHSSTSHEAGPSRPSLIPPRRSITDLLGEGWLETLSTPCHFDLKVFLNVTKELVLHPERNSTVILRADPLPPRRRAFDEDEHVNLGHIPSDGQLDLHTSDVSETSKKQVKESDYDDLPGGSVSLEILEEMRVRLMPKQVKRDSRIDQTAQFYRTASRLLAREFPFKPNIDTDEDHEGDSTIAYEEGLVVLTPEVKTVEDVPYYHPPVKKLAFRWEEVDFSNFPQSVDDEDHESPIRARLSIAYLPFPPSSPAHISLRLHRTLLALLEKVYKHGYGSMVGYVKRRQHDVVVQRESFQDLYLELKEKHRHLDSRAPKPGSSKVEDVKRHVWKDVAVAAFLMLLWKEMYPPRAPLEADETLQWDTWGRPKGGFVDLGCGNGLLVHILISEGYHGKGYELRSRRTWPLYPPKTREALVELPINPVRWFPSTSEEWVTGFWPGKEDCVVKEGVFLIGNHADELTPWLPLLSLIPTEPVPHLSLPCCLHTLDGTFTRLVFHPPPHPNTPLNGFEDGLEAGNSRYKAYIMWLGWMGLMCGWEWEKEGLRVPSTRGWGIVGRKRWASTPEQLHECRSWALGQVEEVRRGGLFKIREKEGKDH
ncbi:hypothetical protein TREMEDRAFT_42864 [Tremella mesenterica DSM 1558]|uniref:uncharacterized protein n=1 Tax=Tremella mesenterica (strain ATCC 24925 / CBS 8224 / DSM 1558 / NBRC 9311 / NRRL Y-6157 / RJB 2259-6 / UBC 559-6) TaxID=578456 RepID=UPI0003F48D12|nr:uncharacterized protein TREMEDRAFT_42864 [Tremella mesenterica DSM 1558]EIW71493.1 hypothetical protein TREMEDRAFT_42864 [Tremella mesenterica DSM 1558]